jgi:hypothetical protein
MRAAVIALLLFGLLLAAPASVEAHRSNCLVNDVSCVIDNCVLGEVANPTDLPHMCQLSLNI